MDLRAAPFLLEPVVRLIPGRQHGVVLRPVRQRSLIAPIEQFAHDRAMCPGVHECFHRPVIRPSGQSPVRVFAVPQQPHRQISRCGRSLLRRAIGIHQKGREVPPRTNSQTGHGDRRHSGRISPPGSPREPAKLALAFAGSAVYRLNRMYAETRAGAGEWSNLCDLRTR